MNLRLRNTLTFVTLLILVGCEQKQSELDVGDPKFAKVLHKSLLNDGVNHQLENTTIKYSPEDSNLIEQAYRQTRTGHTILTFEDKEVREYFYSLLEQKNIKYLPAETSDNGQVLFWPPDQDVADELLTEALSFKAQNENERTTN